VPVDQRHQRGKNLFKGEIACRAEKNQRIGLRLFAAHLLLT
jgi:hypothetical protein